MATKQPVYDDGEVFNPWHRYDLAKAIRASNLSMGAKVTWMALMDHTWDTRPHPQVGYKPLASEIGKKRRQAIRYVQELQNAGLIRVRHQRNKEWQDKNRIEFLWRSPEVIKGCRS